jgi:hypothetical protein
MTVGFRTPVGTGRARALRAAGLLPFFRRIIPTARTIALNHRHELTTIRQRGTQTRAALVVLPLPEIVHGVQ